MGFNNMLKFFVILFIFILTAYADDSCKSTTDDFSVRILDANLNRVYDGTVWIKYDPGIPATPYYQTPPKALDSDGKVHFEVFNQANELTIRSIDCNLIIHVDAGGSSNEITLPFAKHSSIIDVQIKDIYPLDFYVRDDANIPINNASVYVSGITKKTDKTGHTTFYFKNGQYDFLASYMEGKQDGLVTVSAGTQYEVKFHSSPLNVWVFDDQGNALNSNITIFGKTISGTNASFDRVYGTLFDYSVEYRGITKTGLIDLTKKTDANVIYDLNPPTFGQIEAVETNGFMRLNLPVTDSGKYSSGVDTKSFRVLYKLVPSEATTPYSSAQVYNAGLNLYYADFLNLPPDQIVEFKADVKDKEGNKASIDGRFVTTKTLPTNTTNIPNPPPNTDSSPLIYGFVVVLVIAGAAYFVIKKRQNPK